MLEISPCPILPLCAWDSSVQQTETCLVWVLLPWDKRKDGTSPPSTWVGQSRGRTHCPWMVTCPQSEPTTVVQGWNIMASLAWVKSHPCAQYYLNKQREQNSQKGTRETASHPGLCAAFNNLPKRHHQDCVTRFQGYTCPLTVCHCRSHRDATELLSSSVTKVVWSRLKLRKNLAFFSFH